MIAEFTDGLLPQPLFDLIEVTNCQGRGDKLSFIGLTLGLLYCFFKRRIDNDQF